MSNFNLTIIVGWGVFWAYWLISARRTSSQTKRQEPSLSGWLHWILQVLGYWMLLSNWRGFGPLLWRFLPDNIEVRLIGIVILFLGLGFAVWARIHLGQYWSGHVSIKAEHKLIQTGPYKIVRNPIYTGMLFGFIGTAIVIGEIRAWLAIALALSGLFLKIRAEEKFLLEEFGPTYLQYKKKVKTLVPFIV